MAPAKPVHAIEYLDSPEGEFPAAPVCIVFGDEPFLKRQVIARLRAQVLGKGEGDFSLSTFEGATASLSDVLEELSTLAMFGGGKRLVIVEEADDFVGRYRAELEDYVAQPKASGVLILEAASWPATTRLFKAVAAAGLQVECSAPSGSRLTRWLVASAKKVHEVKLTLPVAEQLAEMVGPELGLLDQELAKLALSAGPEREITAEMVTRLVGAWRAKTAWDMLDAALDGNAPQAFLQLDRLILAGEHPLAILGQISASLRRLAAATRVVLAAEAAGRRVTPRAALERAGVKGYFLDKTERQLRRLGRHRGQQLYRWLTEADLDLKGDSPAPPRTVLERLLARISTAPAVKQPSR
jgi:DNA polymerase-3 subunit delta